MRSVPQILSLFDKGYCWTLCNTILNLFISNVIRKLFDEEDDNNNDEDYFKIKIFFLRGMVHCKFRIHPTPYDCHVALFLLHLFVHLLIFVPRLQKLQKSNYLLNSKNVVAFIRLCGRWQPLEHFSKSVFDMRGINSVFLLRN